MKSVITKKGLNLLSQTRADGTVQYWLGFFGLAYVPDEIRDTGDDALSTDMSVLTSKGDNIYNLFQGSMVPSGFNTDREDSSIEKSAASKLYNECMYTSDVMSRYRYHIDEKTDTNKLVVLKEFADGVTEYCQFDGASYDTSTSQSVDSELPIPAPLYYMGEPSNYNVEPPAEWKSSLPNVSSDTRNYSASVSANPPSLQSETWTAAGVDNYDWVASEGNLYTTEPSLLDDYKELSTFWQYQSVSNYNRFHAPANFEGYAVNSDPATRNICKATKLFPMGHYDVKSSISDEKVAIVQYTVDIDMESVFANVANRSTVYYDENGTAIVDDNDNNVDPYPMSFKFNRVGIYAVSVTLHSYNDGDSDTSCSDHHIQMQVNGDEEPILFGVVDLDSPVVMKQGGLMKFSFNLDLNVADTGIVDNSSIYYNLYESDSITWYKNQLIANASTADAVTTIGVQLNYLRKQINEMSSDGSACGIGDDGDRYALAGHTHNYMKNLVDSDKADNGSVRGIYTRNESGPLTVYKSNGRPLIWDETNPSIPRYYDNPTETVPTLINTSNSYVGNRSMGLGENSATLGKLSVNMSENGVIGDSAEKILLIGGKTVSESDKGLNEHIGVNNSHNSIIVASDTTEIEKMHSSLWIGSSNSNVSNRGIFVDHNVANTIGIGRVSVYDHINDPCNPLYPSTPGNYVEYSILSGGIDMYGWSAYSLIFGDGERGGTSAVGYADLIAAIDADATYQSSGATVISSAVAYGGISTSLISGVKNQVGREIGSTIALGNSNQLRFGISNSIIIGTGNNSGYRPGFSNAVAPQRRPYKVMTVDEFNSRYSSSVVADDDHYFDNLTSSGDAFLNGAIVVGNGTISAMSKQGDVNFTHDVNGVCLYISYSRYKVEDHIVIENENADWSCSYNAPINPDMLNSTLIPGTKLNNMLMLGDYNTLAQGSHNSIIIGDDCVSHNITYKNCFISDAESRRVHDPWSDIINSPSGSFNNVWWIGRQTSTSIKYETGLKTSGDAMYHRDSANFITERWISSNQKTVREFSDVFAFVGRNPYQYGYADWYGASNYYSGGWVDYSGDDLYQPCKAPMIYSGGIALGGYGTPDSNFMLMKIGVRGCWVGDTGNTSRRGLDHEPNIYAPALSQVRNIVYLQDDVQTDKPNKVVNANGSFDLYDNYCSDGIHHLQVDSPFAGMALVVQDKQELDGTLHVGLGKVKASGGGSTMIITDFDPDDLNSSLQHAVTIYKNGEFIVDSDATAALGSPSQLTPSSAYGLSFEGVTKAIVYLPWGNKGATSSIYIRKDTLTEGAVYEMEFILSGSGPSGTKSVAYYAGIGTFSLYIAGLNSSNVYQIENWHQWAATDAYTFGQNLNVSFQPHGEQDTSDPNNPVFLETHAVSFVDHQTYPTAVSSKVFFTLVDGKVYVLGYGS